MTDKNPYAAPPNMEGNKGPGSYPTQTQFGQPYPTTQAAFPPQPGFAPYGSPNQSMPQDPYLSNTTTDTDPMVKGFDFSTETIRRGFIRKVYSILSLQLLLTVGAILLATHSEGVGSFLNENIWLLIVSFILVFVCLITLSCCEGVRRTSPHNAIFLGLFTIGESICVSYTTLSYDRDIVLMAIGLTAVVVIALTIFAFQTKWDFTVLGGTLFAALFLFIVVTFILSFWVRSREGNNTLYLIVSAFGVLLFSAYLIYDTQMIMGGDHKYSLSPEEYIFGAIALYLDIINLFLYILRILSAASKN